MENKKYLTKYEFFAYIENNKPLPYNYEVIWDIGMGQEFHVYDRSNIHIYDSESYNNTGKNQV